MAILSNREFEWVEDKDRVCMFCGEELVKGAYWDTGRDIPNRFICIGNCCKYNLIGMYKDVILSEPYEDLLHFKNRIIKDVEEVFCKELERQLSLEKRKLKESSSKIRELESIIEGLSK